MKNLFKMKWGIMALIVAMAFMFGACEFEKDGKDENITGGDIDYESYDTSAALLIDNNTSINLVAFKGSLNEANKLGGIPANARSHALKRNPSLFTKNEDFPLIILTSEQYLNNKGSLSSLTNTPFTRIYVFYNHGGDLVRYDVSDRLGGEYKLVVQNPTSYNVELRLGGIGGETIGYATNRMMETTLYLTEGDFYIFPIFKKYNSQRDTVDSLYPKFTGGPSTGYAFYHPLGMGGNIKEATFNLQTAVGTLNSSSSTSGVAYITVNNVTNPRASIYVKLDGVQQRTTTGVSLFNDSRTFQILMPNVGGGNGAYGTEILVSALIAGLPTNEATVTDQASSDTFYIEADKLYVVNVTGNYTNEQLIAKIKTDAGQGGPTIINLTTESWPEGQW